MNEFTIGFEVEFSGTSERFVSEEAYKTQQKLKDEYMSRDTKHMETISELREQLAAKQDYIKTLEERISNQKTTINGIYGNMAAGNIKLEKFEELENENKVLKERLKEATGIDYTDSTDYISQLGKNILNQRKELRNLNKALERERKRNKELDELYSGAQKDVSMLNLKVMELNQGIRDSADLTWKEKYDELAKECEMYRRIALRNKKENHDKDVAFSKIVNIIDETVTKKEE